MNYGIIVPKINSYHTLVITMTDLTLRYGILEMRTCVPSLEKFARTAAYLDHKNIKQAQTR